MANWEKKDGNKVEYWYVGKTGFTVGEHYGTGFTDYATNYTIQEMLDREKMRHITSSFLPPNTTYKQLLEEMVKTILSESKYSDCSKELALIPEIEAFIADLPK